MTVFDETQRLNAAVGQLECWDDSKLRGHCDHESVDSKRPPRSRRNPARLFGTFRSSPVGVIGEVSHECPTRYAV
jgi:hypothetical protein